MLPVAEAIGRSTLALPFFIRLEDDDIVTSAPRCARCSRRWPDMAAPMVFLGYGKYVRGDRIYALEPIGEDRGDGRRTRVWVDGIAEPLIASRTERTILAEMGQAQSDDAAIRRGRRPQTALFE